VDAKRTHEVRATLSDGASPTLTIRESAYGSREPAEAFETRDRLKEARDVGPHLQRLEARLSRLGDYARAVAGDRAWTPLPREPALDLTPMPVPGYGNAMEFHRYEATGRAVVVTLVGIPMRGPRGTRYLLGRLEAGISDPTLHVIHARLPPALYRSVLAREAFLLAQDDYRRAEASSTKEAQERWWADVKHVVDALIARLRRGHVPQGAWRPEWRHSAADVKEDLAKKGLTAAQQLAMDLNGKAAYDLEDEDTGHARPVEAKAPTMLLDATNPDVIAILQDVRLNALHQRFLEPGQEARLVAASEKDIRDAMKRVRAKARPDEQHLLSLVEASLMLRRALSIRGTRIEPETIHLLRHAPAYL
jgi:hypothetical protein